jgi:hypothetical protein
MGLGLETYGFAILNIVDVRWCIAKKFHGSNVSLLYTFFLLLLGTFVCIVTNIVSSIIMSFNLLSFCEVCYRVLVQNTPPLCIDVKKLYCLLLA